MKKIALIGNPNSGKTSLFNHLTGLRQQTSNFPGTTVSIKKGQSTINKEKVEIIDFPGAYSFFANSEDERINVKILLNEKDEYYPDLVVYVADVTKLSRHLLLASQVVDLGIPCVIVLNMTDLLDQPNIKFDALYKLFNTPIVPISTRSGNNIEKLKEEIQNLIEKGSNVDLKSERIYNFSDVELKVIDDIGEVTGCSNAYHSKLIAHHHDWLAFLDDKQKARIETITRKNNFDNIKLQINETMARYDRIEPIVLNIVKNKGGNADALTDRIDRIVTHKIFGPFLFFGIMLLMFQAVFSWASIPMDWIEAGFGIVSSWVSGVMNDGWISDLIVEGVIPGLAGVFVFAPQIIMLFLFLAIFEESGYMSRVVYMFDHILRKFGLNGRSIVALISSGACAIPAIMSTRTISNDKERLITIMVAPLISCSARIPVYTALIGFVVPASYTVWIFNGQGLAFFGLYLLGIVASLASAYVFKLILKSKQISYLLLELPQYKKPLLKNIYFYVSSKVGAFVKEAGKIILLVSMMLWFLASYGPGKSMDNAEIEATQIAIQNGFDDSKTNNLIASKKIEASYVGIIGKFIEPAVRPLGYDWKMGIALITSFAAREVFVGTMSTIYSIGSVDDSVKVRDRMNQQINALTGEKVYNIATSLSLIIFYVFALQCLSTLAVTYKETKSIKWPIIQFMYMGVLAYFFSFLVFNMLS